MTEGPVQQEPAAQISSMLGLYKAEWLNGKLFDLFTEPGYFGELKTNRPCVLIGGRGTGKTTVLRGLSYQGQFALHDNNVEQIRQWSFYGLYYRVNTNRVTAFRGPELSEERWVAHFAHYMNLIFCSLLLEFATWFEEHTNSPPTLSAADLKKFRTTLTLSEHGDSIRALADEVNYLLLDFEAAINSIADTAVSRLSIQGAPIDALAAALLATPQLRGKQFYFLIDEFENFENYQQRVLNTIIKHASATYTFKVGVRELGWRERATLNPHEQLTSPADYARISIAEMFDSQRFKTFAEKVITTRIETPLRATGVEPLKPSVMFPGMSELDEAALLVDAGDRNKWLASASADLSAEEKARAEAMPVGELYFLTYWTESTSEPLVTALRAWWGGDSQWKTRFVNHFYASLFSIRKGKRGIRKYYCGWEVFLSLANGNIRYLLELVHSAYRGHLESGHPDLTPIAPEIQTRAAEAVGKKNLSELEGLSVEGARLTKLLLSLGRVFQVMADDPRGHTPEVNQFHLIQTHASSNVEERVQNILGHAVMHLALVRTPGNKLMDEGDTRQYDYSIHPIFAPFFVFSHRRKRKLALEPTQLIGLIDRPRETIKEVLTKNNREEIDPASLPDQLRLFGAYYEGN